MLTNLLCTYEFYYIGIKNSATSKEKTQLFCFENSDKYFLLIKTTVIQQLYRNSVAELLSDFIRR